MNLKYLLACHWIFCVICLNKLSSKSPLIPWNIRNLLRSQNEWFSPIVGGYPGPIKCFFAPRHQISAKSAPKKRVIATKLNLRQNCINKVRTVSMLSIKNNKALKLVLFSCRVLWFAWLATKAYITTSQNQMCPLNQLCAPAMAPVAVRLMDWGRNSHYCVNAGVYD